jgi:signal transduction histidine kinase
VSLHRGAPAARAREADSVVGLCDLDGRMRFLDETGRRLVGVEPGQVAHTEFLDYVAFADRAFVREHVMPAAVTDGRWAGRGSRDFDVRLRHFRTGALIPLLWEVFRVDDPHTGDPCAFAGVAWAQSAGDAFYALDRDWRFTDLNAQAVQLLSELTGERLTREAVVGKGIWDELPDAVPAGDQEAFHRAARERVPLDLELRHAAGGPWWDVRLRPSDAGLGVYFRDVTEHRREELVRHACSAQQALVAELGLRALATDDLQPLLDEAAELVTRTLGVHLAAITEVLPGSGLAIRAGAGWREGVVGHALDAAGDGSQAGYTLAARVPVVAEDLAADARFRPGAIATRHGAVSAATVVIAGAGDAPFGVLGALATRRRSFTGDDVHFLQAVANVLAGAAQRTTAEGRLHEVREAERRRIARDLHDGALGELTQAVALAVLARPEGDGRAAHDAAAQLLPALRRVGEQLRGAIYDLRLDTERDRPFRELLTELVEVHRRQPGGVRVQLDLREGVPAGPLGVTGSEVVRLFGEALTNARRHSGASLIRLSVWGSPATLHASIADDGRGFDVEGPASPTGRQGLDGMRERAELVGGRLEVRSAPGRGTEVRFEMALDGAGRAAA